MWDSAQIITSFSGHSYLNCELGKTYPPAGKRPDLMFSVFFFFSNLKIYIRKNSNYCRPVRAPSINIRGHECTQPAKVMKTAGRGVRILALPTGAFVLFLGASVFLVILCTYLKRWSGTSSEFILVIDSCS